MERGGYMLIAVLAIAFALVAGFAFERVSVRIVRTDVRPETVFKYRLIAFGIVQPPSAFAGQQCVYLEDDWTDIDRAPLDRVANATVGQILDLSMRTLSNPLFCSTKWEVIVLRYLVNAAWLGAVVSAIAAVYA